MPSRRTFLAAAGAVAANCSSCGEPALPYQNQKLGPEKRAEDLLRRMSAQQKLALVRGATRLGVPMQPDTRLGIPALHVARGAFQGPGLAATWNPDLALQEGRLIAREALSHGVDQILGPTPAQYGDAPWLASRLTVAGVSGLQGEGLIATVGRLPQPDASTDPRAFQELLLPPFHAAVEEAGVWSVLSDAGDISSVGDLLRREWGFKGFLVSEHPPNADRLDAASLEESARSVLLATFASGVFDRRRAAAAPPQPVERQALDRAIALQGAVLLRNQPAILPLLGPAVRTIALLGRDEPAIRERARLGFQLDFAAGGQPAFDLARKSDCAIVFAERDTALAEAAAKFNRRTVVIANNNLLPGASRLNAPALLLAWSAGPDLAALLFGDANPSGKLPLTVASPQAEPLFPFGHGLSYATFAWSDLRIFPQTPRYGQLIEVNLKLRNTGARPGAEIVQAYLRRAHAAPGPPAMELKAFKRVELAPGETKNVLLQLDERALSSYDPAVKQWAAQPGEFDVILGSSSRDIRLKGGFELFL